VLSRLVIVAAQAVVVVAFGTLMGATIVGNPSWLVLATVLSASVFMAVGFAIGAISSNVDSANMLSSIIVLPLIFLSGAWFPLDGLPGWLEAVMERLPLAPLMDAMRTVAIGGGSLGDIGGELLQVAVWIPVTFALAVVALRPRRTRTRIGEPVAVELAA